MEDAEAQVSPHNKLTWKLVKPLSFLPHKLLRQLHLKVPLVVDPTDGWTIWMDAHYRKYMRKALRNER